MAIGAWLALNASQGRSTRAATLGWTLLVCGWALNAVPVVANGGSMPVSRHALDLAGYSADEAIEDVGVEKHHPADRTSRFRALGDVIPVRAVAVISAGDVAFLVGLVILLAGSTHAGQRTPKREPQTL